MSHDLRHMTSAYRDGCVSMTSYFGNLPACHKKKNVQKWLILTYLTQLASRKPLSYFYLSLNKVKRFEHSITRYIITEM